MLPASAHLRAFDPTRNAASPRLSARGRRPATEHELLEMDSGTTRGRGVEVPVGLRLPPSHPFRRLLVSGTAHGAPVQGLAIDPENPSGPQLVAPGPLQDPGGVERVEFP